ncbi:MAG: RpiB/LacA/LacB family sugar-phosphate isomerase [Pyrinomonadaceae bacterium]|nr:RpiB/LacA/LacB family sugar-phosphate isomerase [Pyrinomonadaceae bacterium]
MSSTNDETRERVRALVREVLAGFPQESPDSVQPSVANPVEHVVVNSLKDKFEREIDRDESAKSLITEDDIRGLEPGSRIRVAADAKFTPLARDLIAERGHTLVTKEPRQSTIKVKSIAIGADHGGFETKEMLKGFLGDHGLKVRDFGTNSKDAVDYPDFAQAVAQAVGAGHVEVGIVVDGAGIGSAMAANKVPGVRAAACYSTVLAKNAREHNGANLLTLGSGQNSPDEIRQIVEAFLSSELTEERHKKRVGKIGDIDRQYRR